MKTINVLVAVLTVAAGLLASNATAQDAAAVPPAPVKKGMTWTKSATDPVSGVVTVGCYNCDPYKGDTPCTTPLPLLCIRKSGPGFPLPLPAGLNNSDQYNKWAGGVIATTAPTAAPATVTAADAACVAAFGTDWRLAEFHDGWGWHFRAYGGVGNPTGKVWAHVNDQPAGTCFH